MRGAKKKEERPKAAASGKGKGDKPKGKGSEFFGIDPKLFELPEQEEVEYTPIDVSALLKDNNGADFFCWFFGNVLRKRCTLEMMTWTRTTLPC